MSLNIFSIYKNSKILKTNACKSFVSGLLRRRAHQSAVVAFENHQSPKIYDETKRHAIIVFLKTDLDDISENMTSFFRVRCRDIATDCPLVRRQSNHRQVHL